MTIEEKIERRALELGFHAVGLATVAPLDGELDKLREWLEKEHHAGMGYMARWLDVRGDPSHPGMVEGARTVVSLAMAYPSEATGPGVLPLIARYARGSDYHGEVRRRLKVLLAYFRELVPGARGRAIVDTAPALERAWAARAGLGWIGRNSCLISPELGSWVVLGELVVTAELEPSQPSSDRCGECRACVEACPAGALAPPDGRVLDARRCLSYWTVEAQSEPPSGLADSPMLFGCDACQLHCPWNEGAESPPSPLEPLPRWRETSLEELAAARRSTVERLIEGTALERAGADALQRRARALTRRA